MDQPFFSVIIPTFNQANFLAETLKSLKSQTFKDFEVIIIDNFSNDGTENIVKKFDFEITYKKFNNYGIIAKSRNFGLSLSRGKWICFLDSDDTWTSDKLVYNYNEITKKKFDVICNSEWIKYTHKKNIKIWCYGPFKKKNFYKEMLFFGNVLATSASSINKNFLTKNNLIFSEKKEFVTCEDYDFFLNIAKLNGKFHFISRPLGFRLIHDKSYSSKISLHKKSFVNVVSSHLQETVTDKINLNKIILYNKIKDDIFLFLYKKKLLKVLKIILLQMVQNPIIIIKMIKKLILKFIKQKYNYFKYKELLK